MSRDDLKRTPAQMRAYIDAVVMPDIIAGVAARKRHTVAKTIAETDAGTSRVTEMVAYINDEMVIWCPCEDDA